VKVRYLKQYLNTLKLYLVVKNFKILLQRFFMLVAVAVVNLISFEPQTDIQTAAQ